MMSLATVVALFAGLLVVVAVATVATAGPAAAASAATGSAGMFTPLQTRILAPTNMPANTWLTVPVDGIGGIPTSGVSAVEVNVTIGNPTGAGEAFVTASDATTAGTPALIYGSGIAGSISNTMIVAVGADGKIRTETNLAETEYLDVQGYYSAGNGTAAPGGYVPVNPTRIVDTRTGLGIAQAQFAQGSTHTIQVGGKAGVPVGASAIFAVLTPISTNTASGYFTTYPSGTRPSTSLNFPGNVATTLGAAVDLDDNGTFQLFLNSAPVDFTVDVLGYFSAVAGTTGAYTPAAMRVYDSRVAPNTVLAGSATISVPITGIRGVPAAGSGISAVALQVEALHIHGSVAGYLRIWADDQAEPVPPAVDFPSTPDQRTNLIVVRPGADGQVKMHNSSSDSVDFVLDVEGWYSNVGTALAANQTRTQKFVTLQAAAGGGGPYVTYQYRKGITGTFANVPVADVTVPGTTTHPTAWPVTTTSGKFSPYTWDLAATVNGGDQLIQVQACYGTSATDANPVCSMPTDVQLAAHAFGDSYDTQQVGPGTLATLTGDYNVMASDVTESSYLGGMSIGRSFTTLAPAPEQANASGVFGPGWTADFAGPVAGDASATVTDNSAQGYLTFTSTDGSTSLYQASTTVGTYPTSFSPVGAAASDGATVSKTSATVITMTDADGTQTTWTRNASNVWATSGVAQAGSADDTTYTTDGAGRPTRILGAVPAGNTCTNPDATRGCRSLTFAYTTVTVAGTARTRLSTVNLVAYDPARSAMATTPVASYSYDSNGRLAQEWDPRITPNLTTGYTYNGTGRLATITPPGLATWTLTYDSTGRLSTTSRPDPSSTAAVSTVIYGVPFTGAGAPVDVGAAASATWGQTGDPAAVGTAVFGPNHTPAGTTAATITSTDWPYAALDFLDANGRNVNTAAYGAGAWQTDATTYDNNGNTVWQLSAGNRAQSLSPTTDTDPAAAAATSSAARAALLTSTTLYNPVNPAEVTDSFGPTHPITLQSGTVVDARTHDATTYDEGAPADVATYMLPTTQTRGAQTLDGIDHDTVTTRLGYDAITTGDTTGWSLHQATSSTVQMGASPSSADLTTITRYNSAGQPIERRLPGGTAGGDARSTMTSYYTATGSGPCASPDQAGRVCTTGPVGQPTTGNPLPVTTTNYDMYEQSLTITAVAGTTTKTTTATYDTAERNTGSSITVNPAAAGGAAVPAITTTYDLASGLPTTSSAGGQILTTGYNNLGQVTTYTDANGNISTTGYDTSGRITSVNDGKATTTYTYDAAAEHRGLPTAENIGAVNAPSSFAATYNPDGQIATETYPTGLEADRRYDNTGAINNLNYVKGSTAWLTFTATHDAQGRITTQNSNTSAQRYTYDADGRLTVTQDTVSTSGSNAACTIRTYSFDKSSNRTALNSYPDGGGNAGGNCSTSTTPTTVTSSYDQANRLTTTGYSYDTLGRTTTVAAADAQGTGSKVGTTGTLTVAYYNNDMVATQTQGGQTRSFALDPMQNRILSTDNTATTSTNTYSNAYDSPAWTTTMPDSVPAQTPANITWARNVTGLDGQLAGTQSNTGVVTLQIANLKGDIVATVNDDPATTSVTTTTEYTEYGKPRTPTATSDTYGWLGIYQRSSDTLGGLTVMGVRLYNSSTGRFLSVDAIAGGNANQYTYPVDPVNHEDTSGLSSWWFKCYNAGCLALNLYFIPGSGQLRLKMQVRASTFPIHYMTFHVLVFGGFGNWSHTFDQYYWNGRYNTSLTVNIPNMVGSPSVAAFHPPLVVVLANAAGYAPWDVSFGGGSVGLSW